MSTILGKKPEENEELKKQKEQLSAVLKEDSSEIPLKKALAISTVAHPLVAFLFWAFIKGLIFLLAILGITLPLFMKPEPKLKDIEFIIVNKPEQKPINENTKLRSDRNSRAGGKHDPKRKEADPEPVTSTSKPQKPSPPPAKATTKTQQKPQQVKKPAPKAPKVPPKPIPRKKASLPPRVKAPKPFSVPTPVPKKLPKPTIPPGGPITSGPVGQSAPTSEPAPIMSPGSSGQNTLKRSPGYSIGGGNAGNPSPGNPDGRPGVDALKEPDFGPYMRELQRRIKRRWNPPRGNKSKRVVLLFKLSKDGRLLSLKVHKTSGRQDSDAAAINAVKAAAPFRPLPPEYRGDDIDIQFTFDYNVFGIGGQKF